MRSHSTDQPQRPDPDGTFRRLRLEPRVFFPNPHDTDAVDQRLTRLSELLLGQPDIDRVSAWSTDEATPAYQRVCAVGGETFAADNPATTVCFSHYYSTAMQTAEEEHAPLSSAIKDATGLDSWVWQSGGMTMLLVTPTSSNEDVPGVAPGYISAVDAWHPDGRLEGTTSYFPQGRETDPDGQPVVTASAEKGGAPGATWWDPPLRPPAWAAKIAAHYRRTDPPGSAVSGHT